MISSSASVLGCGWLGLPLASRLVSDGYTVNGSTTRPEKFPLLKQAGIEPYHIHCSPNIQGDKPTAFFQSRLLFLNIPFRRSLEHPGIYEQQIESVISAAVTAEMEMVIFASSTSVYPKDTVLALEDEDFTADNPRSKVLLEIEQSLLKNQNFDAVILRFAGLYGGSRELGRFLHQSGSSRRSGQAPVNLVHLDDCVEIAAQVIGKGIRNDVLNVCSDQHPTREELYTRKAFELGVDAPVFGSQRPDSMKIVSNRKLKEVLNYQFLHPDPLN